MQRVRQLLWHFVKAVLLTILVVIGLGVLAYLLDCFGKWMTRHDVLVHWCEVGVVAVIILVFFLRILLPLPRRLQKSKH